MRSDFVLAADIDEENVVRPSVADVDGNGKNDVVSVVHDLDWSNHSILYTVENDDFRPRTKFAPYTVYGGAVMSPPTIADVDSDGKKDIVVGMRNGTVIVLEKKWPWSTSLSEKWHYSLSKKWVPSASAYLMDFGGGAAVGDIDNDGTQEVVFSDHWINLPDYPAAVYVLNGKTGALEDSFTYSGASTPRNVSGAFAPVSIANIDSDDNLEIVVPAYYGVLVFDYSPGSLSLKCNTTHGRLDGSAVVIDADFDNEYELVFSTSNFVCHNTKTCVNKTYVVDAQTCSEEGTAISYDEYTRVTPAVADLDSDLNLEIVVSTGAGGYPGYPQGGSIYCYDASSRSENCHYDDSGTLKTAFVSPSIADIDGDDNYEIIIAENNGSRVHVINPVTNASKFTYEFGVFIDSAVAIADIDNSGDGKAEIAVKRTGSPISILAMMGGNNSPPVFNAVISNITAMAGDLIDINASGEVTATDPDGDSVTISYSSPFNSSGLWQTTVNDTVFDESSTEYLIQVQATDDKNLTATGYVEVKLFNSTSHLQNNFTDGTSQKSFNYTQPANNTVYVRLPKEVIIQYAKLRLEGSN